MTSAAIRQELHHIIDIADDNKVAELYQLLQGGISNEKYTAEELAEFYDRLNKYEKGEDPGFSAGETFAYLRANRKKQ